MSKDTEQISTDQSLQETAFFEYQMQSICKQLKSVPISVLCAAAVIAGLGAQLHALPAWLAVLWPVALAVLLFKRTEQIEAMQREASPDYPVISTMLTRYSLLNGLLTGMIIWPLFQQSTMFWQALFTTILLGWCVGSIATSAFRLRSFQWFVYPAGGQLVLAWPLFGNIEPAIGNWGMACLLILLGYIATKHVKDLELQSRESFMIRYEMDALVAQLGAQEQEAIRQAEIARKADDAKSNFLAAASHDLRQPLYALNLQCAVLKLQPLTDEARKITTQIGNSINSLSELLNGLLDMSKLDAAQMKVELKDFDLTKMMKRLQVQFQPIAQDKGVDLIVEYQDALRVHSDRMLLERVIRNLFDNAIRYGNGAPILLKARSSVNGVLITLMDGGPGIPAKEHKKVFEPFYQLNNAERDRSQGLGLGLAIVGRLEALLGLHLKMKSAPGEGTHFSMEVPLAKFAQGSAEAQTLPDPGAAPDLQGVPVLLVEDDLQARLSLEQLLLKMGAEVYASTSVEKGRLIMDESRIDLVIADLWLPGGEMGNALVGYRDSEGFAPPLIVVTGESDGSKLDFIQSQVSAVLGKHTQTSVLFACIRQALADYPRQAASQGPELSAKNSLSTPANSSIHPFRAIPSKRD